MEIWPLNPHAIHEKMGPLEAFYYDAEPNVVESSDLEEDVAEGDNPLVQELVGDLVP
jgi:hypothetical protein